ncbi:putative membrane protein [Mycobacterium ulcerans str. Harvey]|uniref:Membrane protein n=1 Tax=Mycobacterium ulcerans str. Harvey TaxID=1299332 RepID=A0ABN0R4U8_MYCUL|nr:putative membrane protein [Mycobacterium ulcerans str. Harvey]
MGAALFDHRAAPAHLFGALFALHAGPAALAVGVEEHR